MRGQDNKLQTEVEIYSPKQLSVSALLGTLVAGGNTDTITSNVEAITHLFRNMVDAFEEGIIVIDKWGRPIYVNRSVADNCGFTSPNAMLKVPLTEMLLRFSFKDENLRPISRFKLPETQALRGKLPPATTMLCYDKRLNRSWWATAKAEPILNATGKVDGVITIYRDITAVKEAEMALTRLNTELETRVRERTEELRRANESLETEIREREKIEQALRTSQAQLTDAQKIARIGSWEWDVVTDQIAWSDELYEIYGVKRTDFGATFDELLSYLPPEDRKHMQQTVQQAIDKKEAYTIEHRIIRPDGLTRTILGKGSVSTDSKGTVIRLSGIAQDITDRKELENRKDEFISVASHELKTPLAGLKAFTQILEKEIQMSGNAVAERYIQKMNGQISRLTGLVNELLDISKIESGKLSLSMKYFDLCHLAQETIDDIKHATTTHTITYEGSVTKNVHADPDRIEQVLINFLTNAIKYSPEGSLIEVRCSQNDTHATISVRDHGSGIAPDHQEKIFDRFYRATTDGSGLGLGLSISHAIIEAHSGTIGLKSEAGKGSTFYFSLPHIKDGA